MTEIISTTREMCEYNCIAQQSLYLPFGVWKFETVGNLTRSDFREEASSQRDSQNVANLNTDITLPAVCRSEHSLLRV